jgi:NADH-quinone oxidoreductase subunit H
MLAFIIFLGLLLTFVVFAVYAERKVAAFVQDRMGPREVGYKGLGQTVADLLKLIQKEDIVPALADKKLFLIAPLVIFTSVFAGFAVLPFGPDIQGAHISTGVLYLITIISLDVIGLIMAGWGSNNKFSLYGAMRSVSHLFMVQ